MALSLSLSLSLSQKKKKNELRSEIVFLLFDRSKNDHFPNKPAALLKPSLTKALVRQA
jgi:hypothetical protein